MFSAQSTSDILDPMYRCFIHPLDEFPNNRINVMPSMGLIIRMHVSTDDRKTFISSPSQHRILDTRKGIEFTPNKLDAYSTDHGVFSIFRYRGGGLQLGTYIVPDGLQLGTYMVHGATGVYKYLCEMVTPVAD